MSPIQVDHAGNNRLRIVFDDAEVLFDLGARATFEDVAWILGEPTRQRFGSPVAIDVTFAVPPPPRSKSRNPVLKKAEGGRREQKTS